jgi:hypothetical protein
VATVLHLRIGLPDDTIAHLLGTSRSTIRRALTEIGDLLDQYEYHIEPATAPPGLPARIPRYVPQTTGNTENEWQDSVLIICAPLVRPVTVIVSGVLDQDLAEMLLAEDQHVVQALTAKCSHEPFRERVVDGVLQLVLAENLIRLGGRGCLVSAGAG